MILIKLLVIGISLIGILTIAWGMKMRYEYKIFYAYLAVKDPVSFFIDEDRVRGYVWVINDDDGFCVIRHNKSFVNVPIDEIYPVLGYDYKFGKV